MSADSRGPFMQTTHRHPIGIVRREFLQVGFSGLLGLGLPELLGLRGRAEAAPRRRHDSRGRSR